MNSIHLPSQNASSHGSPKSMNSTPQGDRSVECQVLYDDNSKLRKSNSELTERNSKLLEENSKLMSNNSKLKEENEHLKEKEADLLKQIRRLKTKYDELKRKNLNDQERFQPAPSTSSNQQNEDTPGFQEIRFSGTVREIKNALINLEVRFIFRLAVFKFSNTGLTVCTDVRIYFRKFAKMYGIGNPYIRT